MLQKRNKLFLLVAEPSKNTHTKKKVKPSSKLFS